MNDKSLLAHLATERAGLLEQFIGLDEKTLTESPVFDNWTAKDLLAHVAAWDELFTQRVKLVLAGREDEIVGIDLDARNAALYAERRDWSLRRALDACMTARADFVAALAPLPDAELDRPRTVPWGEATVRQWTEWRARHDATHAADLSAWRQEFGELVRVDRYLIGNAGPKEILLAALDAGRKELLTAAALVAPEERTSRPVCGDWTLKDVLGHVADWELWFVDALPQMTADRASQIEYTKDMEAWNQAHAQARRDQPWETVWADLNATRRALLEILDEMIQADLSRSFSSPWVPQDTPYRWVCVFVAHDRQHARDMREAMTSAAGPAET